MARDKCLLCGRGGVTVTEVAIGGREDGGGTGALSLSDSICLVCAVVFLSRLIAPPTAHVRQEGGREGEGNQAGSH